MRASLIVISALLLAACGSTPKPPEPYRLRAALEAESEGAKRYERGDYAFAVRRFDAAVHLYAAIDDAAGTNRNRLHLARSELARGRAEAALALLATAEQSGHANFALDILLLKAQAQLALKRDAAAQQSLAAAATHCAIACPQAASLHLLQARVALAATRDAEALAHAEAALKLLQEKDAAHETGNAWRLMAAARLASGDASGALTAAHNALDIDRKLALPEKIARDWLLIGDIRLKVGAGDTAAAYRRALDVAEAAALAEVVHDAMQSLAKIKN